SPPEGAGSGGSGGLAYAGIPYQSFGQRAGALALTIAWIRSPSARSGSGIAAIFATTALSPSALFLLARASAFSSRPRSFIAACSVSVNRFDVLPAASAVVGSPRRPAFADFFGVAMGFTPRRVPRRGGATWSDTAARASTDRWP